MKYVIRKLWPLILLLIIAAAITVMMQTGTLSGGTEASGFLDRAYAMSLAYICFGSYVVAAGILGGAIGMMIPRRFDPEKGLFLCRVWEKNGDIYDRRFKIRKWKDKLFDLSKATARLEEKSLRDIGNLVEKAERLVQETCVAEVTHWWLITFSPLMFTLCRNIYMGVLWISYVVANILDIMIQRYNRPRLMKILKKKSTS